MLVRCCLVIVSLLLLTACSTPPNREMDRAQGAIDAASAAGAERYAPEEFAAAVTALQQAHAAVEQRDYRTALSQAIDSRDRAQDAARQAADARAIAQSQAERLLTELRILLERGEERVAAAEARGGVSRSAIMNTRGAISSGINAMQEASAAMSQGDYATARNRLEGVHKAAMAAVGELDELLESR